MAGAEATEIFDCPVSDFYKIITDYQNYPKFLSEVKSCQVVETKENKKLVEFKVYMIKSFTYRLWIEESTDQGIKWSFDSGDLFKESNGFWKLSDQNGKTKAIYGVEAKFKMFVPGPVSKALVNVNLPNMMSSYKKRVGELYGK